MSFFGNNNNNNTSSGFGSGGGFGSSTNTGFGANNTATTGSVFGGGNTATTGGFGSGGGFGSANNSPFGAKPSGFGSTPAASGGLFGNSTGSTGGFGSGGGFGSTNNTATSAFGSNAGGGLFGANKPATTGFGSTNTTGSIFGGGGNTSTGFGSNNNTGSTGFGSTNNNATTGFGSTSNTSGGFGAFGATQTTNGTAGTPFQPVIEKDTQAGQNIAYQSITVLPQYKAKTFEELRLEDYLQGRRYGNNNGQAGGFGANTGFGGTSSVFGANNNNNTTSTTNTGSLFGSSNNTAAATTSTGFGGFGSTNTANTNTTGGFGSSNSGGLFGQQNKPAGSLFGSTQPAAPATGGFGSTTGTTGGLFGGGGGFGSTNNAAPATGSSLFGNNNANQNKPAFGGFGSTNTTSGFGATNNNTSTGGLFGSNNNNTTNTTGSLFGNTAQPQQQQTGGFGASTTGGSLFGNQNKPAGSLFGSTATTNTGGGLFGNNNQAQQAPATGSLFGASTTNTGGGLFGNNQAQNKPAGSLFGASTTATNTGGGLFGNNNSQPQQSGSLFGNTNNASGGGLFGNQANKPAGSLFGNTASTPNTGGSLFGQQPNNNAGSSLFGNSMAQPAQNQNNNSLFGGSFGQSNNQTPQQSQLHASLTLAPYGNEQLFGSLGASSTPIGPLATPLTGAKPAQSKTPSLLASTRLNSPVYTPRGSFSRGGTYTYATPSSSFSASLTPGASSLLKPTGSIGSNLGSRLAKSMSMNSLRGEAPTPGERESLLRPVVGSASSRYLSSGSLRKLTIDRTLRIDLFSPPAESKQHDAVRDGESSLRKKVSFDNSASKETPEPNASNALVRTEQEDDSTASPSLFRAAPKSRQQTNGNGPEMQQVNGSDAPTQKSQTTASRTTQSSSSTAASDQDVEVGEYWSKPSVKDLKEMSRAQLAKVENFVVGRAGTGRIEFSSCDLTNTELDDIPGHIVKLEHRSATVYPTTMEKPPRGKGLNVPSTIFLENVLPKNPSNRKAIMAGKQPNLDRFVQGLKNITNTTLKSFDEKTGLWTFTVQHFTTYGFEEDEETEVTDSNLRDESSMLSEPPATPSDHQDETMQSIGTENASAGLDDTFEFKIQRRPYPAGPSVPGGFDDGEENVDEYDDASADEGMEEDESMMTGALADDPFVDQAGGAVQAPSPRAYQRYEQSMLIDAGEPLVEDLTEEMPGSFLEEPKGLRSILKPSTTTFAAIASPEKLIAESWEDQLQRTISPKKRDRQALKHVQLDVLEADEVIASPFKQSMLGQSYLAQKNTKTAGFAGNASLAVGDDLGFGKSQAFRNSMDLMNSLWATDKPVTRRTAALAKGFENPYPKKPRVSASTAIDSNDLAFHECIKPSFGSNGTLVYGVPGSAPRISGELQPAGSSLVGEHIEIRFARWNTPMTENAYTALTAQKAATRIESVDGFPRACVVSETTFSSFAVENSDTDSAVGAWRLASVLFDPITTACAGRVSLEGMDDDLISQYEERLRFDAVSAYWTELLKPTVQETIRMARTGEEVALLALTMNDVAGACQALTDAKNYRLATLVAQLPLNNDARGAIKKQIKVWCDRNDWSEMPDPIRAMYSILAGEFGSVTGSGKAPEDRAEQFCIAQRFGWDWKQSFALRLHFGEHLTCGEAVDAYLHDLRTDSDTVAPSPAWDVTHKREDKEREDVLFGLLRLTASTHADLDMLFDAKNISGTYSNNRIAFQLASIFFEKGYNLPDEQFDHVVVDFAAELEAGLQIAKTSDALADGLVTLVWVLLHLRGRLSREASINNVLLRNAHIIPEQNDDDNTNVFTILTQDLMIPEELVWEAKAQHESTLPERNAALQALWLLRADCNDEAHRVLVEIVGPDAVIEEDYEDLDFLISAFAERRARPEGWNSGGAVYESFVRLTQLSRSQQEGRRGAEVRDLLYKGLRLMEENSSGIETALRARVAMTEMKRLLKEATARESASSLRAPLRSGRDAMDLDDESSTRTAFQQYSDAMRIVA